MVTWYLFVVLGCWPFVVVVVSVYAVEKKNILEA